MVTIFSTDNGCEAETKALKQILESDFAGVLFEPSRGALPRTNPELFAELGNKFPVILIDTYYPGANFPMIAIDDEKGGYIAAKYLIDHGHKDIMHLGKIDDTQGLLRYKGYLKALSEAGIDAVEDNLLCITNDMMPLDEFFENNASNIINRLKNVTAVFCYNDQIADIFVSFAASHGIRIPEDISIIGYDDSLFATQHRLTCVAHPKELLGKTAAENMLKLLENPTFDPSHIFEPYLIIRDSVKDIC